MLKLLLEVDRLLRGELTSEEDLKRGKIAIAARRLALLCLMLGMFYGIFMGIFGATRESNAAWQQLLATTVKVPLVFLLTLFVTFPSLYVFSALVGSRCRSLDTLRLLVASIGVTLAILASFGPITGFFTLSTTSYPFMVLLNVAFFGVAGLIGLGFLRRALERVIGGEPVTPGTEGTSETSDPAKPSTADRASKEAQTSDGRPASSEPDFVTPVGEDTPSSSSDTPRPNSEAQARSTPGMSPPSDAPPLQNRTRSQPTSLPSYRDQRPERSSRAIVVFRIWVVIYGVVGAQMGWILRPFIGTPDSEFSWFRPRSGSFLEGVGKAIAGLFG